MLRQSVLFALILLIAVAVIGVTTQIEAQAQAPNAWAVADINLRVGPGTQFDVVDTVPAGTPFILDGRNKSTSWVLVHTQDNGVRGWAKTTLLKVSRDISLYRLPITEDTVPANGVQPTPPPMPTVDTGHGLTAPIVPQITPAMRATARRIRAIGRQLGNNPAVFSKVGDCMSDHWAFLNVFGYKTYDLGPYGYLQGVIDRFSVPPRDGVPESFSNKSQASLNGFNSAAVQDTTLSDPKFCGKRESPLDCEYRLDKPGIAIIMFGTADVLVMTPTEFNFYLRGVVKKTMDRGILPLLSTFPEDLAVRDKSRQINQVVLTIAREKNLPVMNLQAALASLPNSGIDSDGIHLTIPPDGKSGFFTPDHLQFGYTVRNLVTLQALDVVWRQLMN